jgi:hypothetical protein
MAHKQIGPTSKENIAINIIFEWMEESRYNRTYDEYMEIARKLPKLAACHAYVNQRLKEYAKSDNPPFQAICYLKAGDKKIEYHPFPTSLSMETIRMALINMGMRKPVTRQRRAG